MRRMCVVLKLVILSALLHVRLSQNLTVIKVGFLGMTEYDAPYAVERIGPAVHIAINKINNEYLNASYRLELLERHYDNMCSARKAPGIAADLYYEEHVVAFIGPACFYALEATGRLANHWNTPIITGVGDSGRFKDKEEFPVLTRFAYCQCRLRKVVGSILGQFGWTTVYLIFDRNDLHSAVLGETLEVGLQLGGTYPIVNGYYSNDRVTNYHNILKEVSLRARICILIVSGDELRKFMLAAFDLNYTSGEFAFIDVELFPFPGEYWGNHHWRRNDNRDEDAKQAYQALLRIGLYMPNNESWLNFSSTVKNMAEDLYNFTYVNEEVTFFTGAFHDAVLWYGKTLNKTLEWGYDWMDGYNFTREMWDTTFSVQTRLVWKGLHTNNFQKYRAFQKMTSDSGIVSVEAEGYFVYSGITGDVIIDDNGDRDTSFSFLDMNPTTGEFEVIAVYWGDRPGFTPYGDRSIHWPGTLGVPPKNEPACGYSGDNPSCASTEKQVLLIAVISAFATVIVSFILAFFAYRRYRWEKDLQNMSWLVHYNDIKFASHQIGASSVMSRGSMRSAQAVNPDKKSLFSRTNEQMFAKVGVYKTTAYVPLFERAPQYRSDEVLYTAFWEKEFKNLFRAGVMVAVKSIARQEMVVSRQLLMEMKQLRDLHNENLVAFIGACLDPGHISVLSEYCKKGSLQDVLQNDQIVLDLTFKMSLVKDIVKGMVYLHSTDIKCHGKLRSSNCVVDGKFVVKITDFGLNMFYESDSVSLSPGVQEKLLWVAPEILRSRSTAASVKGDVYSFAIILEEVITRSGPFDSHRDLMAIEDILDLVMKKQTPPFRPKIMDNECPMEMRKLIEACWDEEPESRPDFQLILHKLRRMDGCKEGNLVETLLQRMEQYAANLENIVEERTDQLMVEKRKSEQLLYQILPKSVAEQLKQGIPVQPENYNCVTIYFSDIVGFTALSSQSTPFQVVDFLNSLYTLFDGILENYDVYKVETIGDAYMVVSGLPGRNGEKHASEISRMALKLLSEIQTFEIKHAPGERLKLRIGLHSGPCVAGVVGLKMPRYCLFGDTVNTASRFESTGEPLKIHLSPSTKDIIDKENHFSVVYRGEVPMKGKGVIKTYWLTGEVHNPVYTVE